MREFSVLGCDPFAAFQYAVDRNRKETSRVTCHRSRSYGRRRRKPILSGRFPSCAGRKLQVLASSRVPSSAIPRSDPRPQRHLQGLDVDPIPDERADRNPDGHGIPRAPWSARSTVVRWIHQSESLALVEAGRERTRTKAGSTREIARTRPSRPEDLSAARVHTKHCHREK